MRNLFLLAWQMVLAVHAGAAILREDFASDPAARGWQIHGDRSLFNLNTNKQALDVTWDSSHPNSYFYHPLDSVLRKSDDFSLEIDLRMESVEGGVFPGKPFAFELAFGLLNLSQATNASFLRGTAANSPNLVEFDYFPDTGYGATVSPIMVSRTGQFIPTFNFPLELTPGDEFHIVLSYTAQTQTLATTMTRHGEPFGPIQNVVLSAAFTDFEVDAVSLSSYSDAGQKPGWEGSILAQGTVDNLVITYPDPPIRHLKGRMDGERWQVSFDGNPGWHYGLERSGDFRSWLPVTETGLSTNSTWIMKDDIQPAVGAFYRIKAERP